MALRLLYMYQNNNLQCTATKRKSTVQPNTIKCTKVALESVDFKCSIFGITYMWDNKICLYIAILLIVRCAVATLLSLFLCAKRPGWTRTYVTPKDLTGALT